jgi:ketosteroid isomerase-like protein
MESSGFGEILRAVSPEDLEAFKRGVEAFNRRDVEGLLAVLDPDIEWHDVFTEMLGGEARVVRGHEGVRELIRDQAEAFAELDTEYTEIRDLGQRLVGIGVIAGLATLRSALINELNDLANAIANINI